MHRKMLQAAKLSEGEPPPPQNWRDNAIIIQSLAREITLLPHEYIDLVGLFLCFVRLSLCIFITEWSLILWAELSQKIIVIHFWSVRKPEIVWPVITLHFINRYGLDGHS